MDTLTTTTEVAASGPMVRVSLTEAWEDAGCARTADHYVSPRDALALAAEVTGAALRVVLAGVLSREQNS